VCVCVPVSVCLQCVSCGSVVDVRQCCRVCTGRKEAEPSGADALASISASASAVAARRDDDDEQLDLIGPRAAPTSRKTFQRSSESG